MTARRTLAFAISITLAACSLVGCDAKVNAETYAMLKPGMSLSQVEKALGGKGELDDTSGVNISAAGMAGSSRPSSRTTYTWRDGGSEISATFDDGKLVTTGKRGF